MKKRGAPLGLDRMRTSGPPIQSYPFDVLFDPYKWRRCRTPRNGVLGDYSSFKSASRKFRQSPNRRAVDKIEDARFPNFNKAQQSSTSCVHIIETEYVENRRLVREAGIRLGHRCATLKRIFRFNNLEGRGC
jgi:hypothetical protein